MNKTAAFKKSVKFIESRLSEEINLRQAALSGFTSLMQLYRDFYTYTGHSVKEYIRKRRVSNALSFIKFSDLPLAEIAYLCGYSSQQALCRFVKEATGMTPLAYKAGDSCYYFPMFNGETARQVSVVTETLPERFKVKYYASDSKGIEDTAFHKLLEVVPDYGGRIFGNNVYGKDGRFCYELAVEARPDLYGRLKKSPFSDAAFLPGQTVTHVKTTAAYHEDTINKAWDYLFTTWLRTSMFTRDGESCLEEYLHKDGRVKKLILYLPVKKRADYDQIHLARYPGQSFITASAAGPESEKVASQAVVNYMEAFYPILLKETRLFYVSKSGLSSTCGLKPEGQVLLPSESSLKRLYIPEGLYGILESSCCPDTEPLEAILRRWIAENGFQEACTPAFTLHEASGSFDIQSIKTRIFIRLKEGHFNENDTCERLKDN